MTQTFHVGMIGWGLAGRYFHAPFVQAVAGLQLTAVATSRDIDPTLFPGVAREASAEALIARPDIDLVIIASPNRLHLAQATAVLQAGKHVIIEKPVTETAAEWYHLIQLAQTQNRLLVPFQNRRWDGDFQTVRQLVHSGQLGNIHYYASHWPKYRPTVPQRATWKSIPDPTSGLLYDLGPHLIDQALVLFGVPHTVFARVAQNRPGSPSDDFLHLELRYRSGLVAVLQVDELNPFVPARYEVRGALGAFRKYGLDPQEPALVDGAFPQGDDWGQEPESDWGILVQNGVETAVPTLPGDYRPFYQSVASAMAGSGPGPIPPEEILPQLNIIAAARESTYSGQAVSI